MQNECVKAIQEENTYHRQVLPLLLDYTATICGRLVSGKDDISGVPVWCLKNTTLADVNCLWRNRSHQRKIISPHPKTQNICSAVVSTCSELRERRKGEETERERGDNLLSHWVHQYNLASMPLLPSPPNGTFLRGGGLLPAFSRNISRVRGGHVETLSLVHTAVSCIDSVAASLYSHTHTEIMLRCI